MLMNSVWLSGLSWLMPFTILRDYISGINWLFYDVCVVLQENYFGDDQKFTDLESDIVTSGKKASLSEPQQPVHCPKTGGHSETHAGEDDQFDARCYRPLHVTVQLDVCDVQAHLVKVKRCDFSASNVAYISLLVHDVVCHWLLMIECCACVRTVLKMVLRARLCSWRDWHLRWTNGMKKQSCRYCCHRLCLLPRISIRYRIVLMCLVSFNLIHN